MLENDLTTQTDVLYCSAPVIFQAPKNYWRAVALLALQRRTVIMHLPYSLMRGLCNEPEHLIGVSRNHLNNPGVLLNTRKYKGVIQNLINYLGCY